MRLFRPWSLLRILYPGAVFRIKTEEKILCLTFDDGPDPASTPVILGILDKYNVKAFFFCKGESAQKYPDLISSVRSYGHIIGNHGYKHCDGWRTSPREYYENAKAAEQYTSERYFRPPFGHMTIQQFKILSKTYRIIFWDIMAYDFDPGFGPERSLKALKKKIRPGSIIVLHDSADSACTNWLEAFIVSSKDKGYKFGLLC